MTTIPDLTNTSSWSDEDLIALYGACLTEQERRRRLIDLPAQVEQMTRQYLDARDGTHPTEQAETLADVAARPVWVQPTGAHDSYPAGWIVKHGGVLYQSLIAANVWEPGGEGDLWEKVTAKDAGEAPTTPTAPAWDGLPGVRPPVGAADDEHHPDGRARPRRPDHRRRHRHLRSEAAPHHRPIGRVPPRRRHPPRNADDRPLLRDRVVEPSDGRTSAHRPQAQRGARHRRW